MFHDANYVHFRVTRTQFIKCGGGKMCPKESVKQNETCAVHWPFCPKVLQF
jgi:hypothetical protein